MREIVIKATGCHDCPCYGYNGVTEMYRCKLKLNISINKNIEEKSFHSDCPMVEVKENISTDA